MINKFIDLTITISFLSIVPSIILFIPSPWNFSISFFITAICLSFLNFNNKKETQSLINTNVDIFLNDNNYEILKETMYNYPFQTLFILKNKISKKEILNLDFSKINKKEFNPDLETVSLMIDYLESKKFEFAEVETNGFIDGFFQFVAKNKTTKLH